MTIRLNLPTNAGVRAALERYFKDSPPIGALTKADHFLATLWTEGFKIVPLDPADDQP